MERREVGAYPGLRAAQGIVLALSLVAAYAVVKGVWIAAPIWLALVVAVLTYFRRGVRREIEQAKADEIILDRLKWESREAKRFGFFFVGLFVAVGIVLIVMTIVVAITSSSSVAIVQAAQDVPVPAVIIE